MTTKDGGTAFPLVFTMNAGSKRPDGSVVAAPEQHLHGGMSLRDWFAGQALTGMMANHTRFCAIVTPADTQENGDRKVAEQAYRHADAMLAAREGERT